MSTRKWTHEPWQIHSHLPGCIEVAGMCNTADCPVYSTIVECQDTWQTDDDGRVWTVDGGKAANAARIVQCVNACAGMDDPAKEIAALREALRAAEAECSEWRAEFATYGPDGQANDTIRAKLGLPKIGGDQ